MTKYYVVIDTNVLVSAMLKWDSVPGNIIELVFEGPIIPVLNADILNEYRAVLLRPKFHWTEEIVNPVLETIESKAIFADSKTLQVDLPDPKDCVFYEVVMGQRDGEETTYLVTGNIRHFPVKSFIVTPRQMLDIILGDKNN